MALQLEGITEKANTLRKKLKGLNDKASKDRRQETADARIARGKVAKDYATIVERAGLPKNLLRYLIDHGVLTSKGVDMLASIDSDEFSRSHNHSHLKVLMSTFEQSKLQSSQLVNEGGLTEPSFTELVQATGSRTSRS